MTDSELIALLNNRDETAIEALEARFGGLCRSLASNILADERDVEECVSCVLFKLWSAIPPAAPRDLTAYVAKAVRNEALTRFRSQRAERGFTASVTLEELEDCLVGSESAEDGPAARAIAQAVEGFAAGLPAVQRGVFMRRYWFFDSAKAIAERFGLTEARVNKLLNKTRRDLKRYLVKEEYISE